MYFSNHNPLPDRDLVELQWLEVDIPFLFRQVGRRSDLIFYPSPYFSLPSNYHSLLSPSLRTLYELQLPPRKGSSLYSLGLGTTFSPVATGQSRRSDPQLYPSLLTYQSLVSLKPQPLPERDLVELQWLEVGIPFLSRQVGRRSDLHPYSSLSLIVLHFINILLLYK